MPITKPQLPPLTGYAETEADGRRVYRNIETGEILGQETPRPDPSADLAELAVDHEYRITLLELGVTTDAV